MSLDYTTSYGSTVNYPDAAQRVSTNGPLLIQGYIIQSHAYSLNCSSIYT